MADELEMGIVGSGSLSEQFTTAVRDLWTMLEEVDNDHVVFMDRRRLNARVERTTSGVYRVSWETIEGNWISHPGEFENLREATFHGYQGPH